MLGTLIKYQTQLVKAKGYLMMIYYYILYECTKYKYDYY